MADWGCVFSFFQSIHVRIDTNFDISISLRPMTIKFGKQVYLEDSTEMRLIEQMLVTSSC